MLASIATSTTQASKLSDTIHEFLTTLRLKILCDILGNSSLPYLNMSFGRSPKPLETTEIAAPVPSRPTKLFSWADDAIEESQEYERARSASSSLDSTLSWSYEDVRVSDCQCSTTRRQCTDLSKTPEQETPTSSPPRLLNADGVLVDHELLALSFEENITDQQRPKYQNKSKSHQHKYQPASQITITTKTQTTTTDMSHLTSNTTTMLWKSKTAYLNYHTVKKNDTKARKMLAYQQSGRASKLDLPQNIMSDLNIPSRCSSIYMTTTRITDMVAYTRPCFYHTMCAEFLSTKLFQRILCHV
jgi:hypothetical protein